MPIFIISSLEPSGRFEVIEKAVSVLESGGVIIFPTETVYGLAFRLDSPEALKKFLTIKKRDAGKPITRHVGSLGAIFEGPYKINHGQGNFIREFLPGPVTVILEREDGKKEGIRCPSNPTAVKILDACGFPVGASSVNISGEKPLSNGSEIGKIFGGIVDMVIVSDGEVKGIESTVVDISSMPFKILRQGENYHLIRAHING